IFGTFLVSLLGTYMVQELAIRSAILDAPNQRSSHTVPVPRLGGVAIAVAVLFGVLTMAEAFSTRLLIVLAVAAVMVVAGIIDDLRPISPLQKYGPQVLAAVAASVAVQPDVRIALPFLDLTLKGLAAIIFCTFFITAVINAFNFMDG